VLNPSAPAGKEWQYAKPELERRFLLATIPGDVRRRVHLHDRYLHGTRLRLRRQQADDGSVFFKLTQKIPQPDGSPGLISTLYLDEAEYRALETLPADTLRKVRLDVPPFAVDLFAGRLAGLLIGEIEFATEQDRNAYAPPPDVVVDEITGDPRLTCAALAGADPRRIATALAAAHLSA
jgi:CYTH domain-containing protein